MVKWPVALLLVAGLVAAGEPVINDNQPWGAASNGLQLAISPITLTDKSQPETEFYVAFRNVGEPVTLRVNDKPAQVTHEQDYVLNLGSMLNNGRVQLPEAIWLILTDAQGKQRELQFADKRYPGVAGRVDDLAVPLRFGSVYVLLLDLDQFWSPSTNEFELKLPKGRYRITAKYEGKGNVYGDARQIPVLPYWTGTLQSNELEFEITKEQPARLRW